MATGQFVEHTYDQPGLYTAVVTAITPFGTLTAETAVAINVSSEIDPETGGTLIFFAPAGWGIDVQVPPNAVEERIGLTFLPLNRDEIEVPPPPKPSTYFFDLDPVIFPSTIFLPYITDGSIESGPPTAGNQVPASSATGQATFTTNDTFPFLLPITVTVIYTDDQIPGLDEETLILSYWDGTQWLDAITTCDDPAPYDRDPANNRITLQICHLTRFGLSGN
jgi:PKD repeat protein